MKSPSRIVTRADLDGLVCAVLIREVFKKNIPVLWAEPSELERGVVRIIKGDVIANLPYHENCLLWFDHHPTNSRDEDFNGRFEIAPSAAGIIFKYYEEQLSDRFTELVNETDRIDSAALNEEEVLDPSKSPYFLVSLTVNSGNREDIPYWEHLLNLFQNYRIEEIVEDPLVRVRTEAELKSGAIYRNYLEQNTIEYGPVTVTDFRKYSKAPSGNRFLVFSLFPGSNVNVKVRKDNGGRNVIVSVGHSIFRKECRVHCGKLVSRFGGGGHFGAGSCMLPIEESEKKIETIIEVLRKNNLDNGE